MHNDELTPSRLGTKQHWDEVYKNELRTFKDCGDEGEVWFGEPAVKRMINSLLSLTISTNDLICDVGCGNGMLIVKVWEAGFRNLLGVDYSAAAIDLASSVAKANGCNAAFQVQNIVECPGRGDVKVVLDKGTYDAISLSPDNAVLCREAYLTNVASMLMPDGFLIITTCNWTEAELVSHFKSKLTHLITVPSAKFTFGGKSGHGTTMLVFQKSAGA